MKTFVSAALLLLSSSAFAHSYTAGDVAIGHPWARATPGPVKTGAAYLTLQNKGKSADTLQGADGDVADRVEIHNHINDNGVLKMRRVDGVSVEPGQRVALQPGSYHIMLIGLKKPLLAGESFPLTLHFKRAGDVRVDVKIEATTSEAPAADAHGEH
ncbi:hypothetical protein DFO50_102241 [Microvirgula sp. AG722]|uniref:copper chaperone PCu(A)C n=1 Tax=Microvirgula sp. AG722 TaxID=2183901 RepID=UPI000DC5A9CF|nr:copper chaperone PCu(A)C [Microvirgula sp. AG722]RAS19082.1 hypothetical protein DFO50_102241 [Microvirgula sp. AG722]